MKVHFAIVASFSLNSSSVVNGETTNTTSLVIESWRNDDKEIWDSTLIPAFEANHPDITVAFKSTGLPPYEYDDDLSERLANGTAGDLITARPFDLSLKLFNEGYLADVTDMSVLDNYPDEVKMAWQTDYGMTPKTYAIPMANVMAGIFYNKDAFETLGAQVPKTQEEFFKVLEVFKQDGMYVPLAMGRDGDLSSALGAEEVYMNIGPNFWKGETGRVALVSGKEKLTDDQWVEPWRVLEKMVPYTGDTSQTYEESLELFMSGEAAMIMAGSWNINLFKNGAENSTFSIGVFKPPVIADGDQCYIQDHVDMAMAINTASPNQEAAKTFLDWIGSEEFNTLYANALPGFFPVAKFDVQMDDDLQGEFFSWRETCESTIRPFAQFLDRGPDPTLTQQSAAAFENVVNGISSPEEVSASMQKNLESWYEPQQLPIGLPPGPSSSTTIKVKVITVVATAFMASLLAIQL